MRIFEKLFKCVDWRHNSLVSESILQKGFRVYNFLSFYVKYLFFFFFFFCVCLICVHLGKNSGILTITVWKRHRSLEDLYIIQMNHGINFLSLEVV